jgi:hypothetical protein
LAPTRLPRHQANVKVLKRKDNRLNVEVLSKCADSGAGLGAQQ